MSKRRLTKQGLRQLSGRLPPEGGQLSPELQDVTVAQLADLAYQLLQAVEPLGRCYCPVLMGRMDPSMVVLRQPNPAGERQLRLQDLRLAHQLLQVLA